MPYITVKQSPAVHQLSLEEILAGPVDLSKFVIRHAESNTRTYLSQNPPPSLGTVASPETLTQLLEQFAADHSVSTTPSTSPKSPAASGRSTPPSQS